ncbi:MAG: YqgE/AlgH family protein [Parvularculaceae bacterium]
MAERDFLTGNLLIAAPNMGDPRFERAVALICAHDEEHAMGVVVNKPLSNVEIGDLLEPMDIDPRPAVGGEPVYYGGPVQTDRGLVIHTLDYRIDGTIGVTAEIGLTVSREILRDIAGVRPDRTPSARFCFAIGYAGWGPGQLEDEIRQNAWAHCPIDEEIVFAADPEASWSAAFERLGVTAAIFSPAWASARDENDRLN